MSVNNVSFGKIIKVNAPVYVARQIIKDAKTLNNKNTNWKTKKFFRDVTHKPSYVYSFTNAKENSYIFTGKDAQKCRESYDIAYDTMTYVHYNYAQEDLADLDTKLAWDAHEKRIKKLVDSNKRIKSIDVKYNKDTRQVSEINFSA